ncbi:MAG: hypothetical protein K8S98_03540 [Planctomycetes bacterium]|nr:hypothetical protein [Planctomycetota bacterium]
MIRVFALALTLCAAQGEPALPKRAPIAHLAGFESVSTVRFAAEPARAQRLVATYVFPARTRWLMTVIGEPTKARTVHYRSGQRWFVHDDGSATSRELAGDEREQIDHFFTLRQALVLWPDGFAWSGGDNERTTEAAGVGKLVATLGDDGRPRAIVCRDAAGGELEGLREVKWRADRGRAVPEQCALTRRGEVAWRETIEAIEFEVGYLDEFFTPVDRRPHDETTGRELAIESVELPARLVRPLSVELSDDWHELSTRANAARNELEAKGLKLDDGVEVELDASGKATRCLARLAEDVAPTPPEWTRRPGASALSFKLTAPRADVAAALAELLRRVPAGSRPGTAYVRITAGADGRSLQLVLPLAPDR